MSKDTYYYLDNPQELADIVGEHLQGLDDVLLEDNPETFVRFSRYSDGVLTGYLEIEGDGSIPFRLEVSVITK